MALIKEHFALNLVKEFTITTKRDIVNCEWFYSYEQPTVLRVTTGRPSYLGRLLVSSPPTPNLRGAASIANAIEIRCNVPRNILPKK